MDTPNYYIYKYFILERRNCILYYISVYRLKEKTEFKTKKQTNKINEKLLLKKVVFFFSLICTAIYEDFEILKLRNIRIHDIYH